MLHHSPYCSPCIRQGGLTSTGKFNDHFLNSHDWNVWFISDAVRGNKTSKSTATTQGVQTPFAYNYIGHLYLSVLPFSIKAQSFSTPWLLRLLPFYLSHPSRKKPKICILNNYQFHWSSVQWFPCLHSLM